jgi:hypothetical protein
MKNSTQTPVILKSLDLELKAILTEDIKLFKTIKNNPTFLRQKVA